MKRLNASLSNLINTVSHPYLLKMLIVDFIKKFCFQLLELNVLQ